MGKGDKKSKKGKIASGSYGVRRPRKSKVEADVAMNPPKEVKKPVKKTAATTSTKKTAAKKKDGKKDEK